MVIMEKIAKMSVFMDHTHADAFVDYPMREPDAVLGYTKMCPKCQGHGGWNLALNQYSLHGKENTPENRHTFSHFTCMCGNCYGWGFVREDQTCVHDWKFHSNTGRCLNMYQCIHCGQLNEIDSSD